MLSHMALYKTTDVFAAGVYGQYEGKERMELRDNLMLWYPMQSYVTI